MSEKAPRASESLEDLDQLSAFEESMEFFGIGNLDSEHGVILKDWSAQDFAHIYVRFRPHLISHARNFLREQTQAEEVVQDAFLYLMTSLPELDSELGVLRFLKWKTRMLCLDIIRSTQPGKSSNLVPLPAEVADATEPLDFIERADDAAIIRLALAKLNPRQREALIETMYEEKSHEEVARQMGVSENAFRQLLFRARASFRHALVGEAEIEGKSIAEILTVAARKAASARNAVFVTLLFMTTLTIPPMLNTEVQIAEGREVAVAASAIPGISNQRVPTPSSTDQIAAEKDTSEQSQTGVVDIGETDTFDPPQTSVEVVTDPPSLGAPKNSQGPSSPEEAQTSLAREAFNESLDENLVIELASQGLSVSESNGQLTATNQAGLQANFAVDLSSERIVQYVVIEFESEGKVWKAVPENSLIVVEELEGQTLVSYAATDFLVGDFSGDFDYVSTSESVFSRSGIKLDLVFDDVGRITSSQVTFLPKT